MRLSILDQAPISKGNTSVQTLKNAEELALLGDELGYHRFWMSEHHSTDVFASSAPEINIAYLASKTKNIRYGTGGLMMMHYSPLKVAETISTLNAFTDGKIDLGVGRAPGGDSYAVYALSQGHPPTSKNLYEKLETTLKLLKGEIPGNDLYRNSFVIPNKAPLPEVFLLGSSGGSSLEAGRIGVGYAFAQFLSGDLTLDVINTYRENFNPSTYLDSPKVAIGYLVTTAETKEEAEYHAKSQDIWRLHYEQGVINQIMSPEEANDYPLTEIEKMTIQENRKIHFVGNVKEIAAKLRDEQEIYNFDEAIICCIQHSQEFRVNGYKLLARELID